MSREEDKVATLTQSQILERPGWTRTLVKRILGEPDLIKPRFGGGTINLYQRERVEAAEASEAFLSQQDAVAKRKAAARRVVEKKTAALLADVDRMSVRVTRIPLEDVRRRAIKAYNDRHWGSDMPAGMHSDSEFLDRITVNYIRHKLTRYDQALGKTAGKVGVHQAVDAIREKVYAAIAEAYPDLAEESRRQLARRREEEDMRRAMRC